MEVDDFDVSPSISFLDEGSLENLSSSFSGTFSSHGSLTLDSTSHGLLIDPMGLPPTPRKRAHTIDTAVSISRLFLTTTK